MSIALSVYWKNVTTLYRYHMVADHYAS